jgi:hypothetical protein
MERVTINIAGPDLELVKQQAGEAGTSVSAYVAKAAHDRALADCFAAAAEAERDFPPTDEEMRRDAERIAAKYAGGRHSAVPGAA